MFLLYLSRLALVYILVFQSLVFGVTRPIKNVPMVQVSAVTGEPVYLPCDISTHDDEDSVVLVLWYREDLGTPIYSVDARERDFGVAERWSDDSVFASRAYFLPERSPAELGVDRVKPTDQGIYRCRVDFKKAQTRNSRVNLTIIVPPQKIVISDARDEKKQAIVGPYVEGDSFMLKCDVYGGKPRPWVKWYRDEIEVDTASSILPDGGVRGIIRVSDLVRSDVRRTLTCKAANHPRVQPIEATLMIDMNFPPVNVHILGSNQPISAGRRYDLLCQSSGSRPPASITWWKNGKRMNNAKETLSGDGNTTTSTISLVFHKNDSGARLACRAQNPSMSLNTPLEDGWTLDVQYLPEPRVRLGTNLDPYNIREGSDVYFDCIVVAHPYVYRVEWRHNGVTLSHNVARGVIISNQSLVLQSVSRHTGGNYTCVGFNAEGDDESYPFQLNVLYSPTCRVNQQRVHGVAKQEKAQITCHVDANPSDVQFRWMFNNTANSMEVGSMHVSKSGTSSTVSYTPLTEMDYGTLLCWATNKIGSQKVPCAYHIIPAGRPDPVHNCSTVNASLTSFGVRCSEGFNGGMPQTFQLEIKDATNQELISNITSAVPRFIALGLRPGNTYTLSIYAFNIKGHSEPQTVKASTLRPPEKRHTADKGIDLPRTFPSVGVMPIALGVSAGLLLVCILLTISVRRRKSKPRVLPPLVDPNMEINAEKPWQQGNQDDSETDDRNPDLIPADNERFESNFINQHHQVATIKPPKRSTSGPSLSNSRTPPDGQTQPYNNSEGNGSGLFKYRDVSYHRGGSVAGLRGYSTLRPVRESMVCGQQQPITISIPPPALFASGACTLPRGFCTNPSPTPIQLRAVTSLTSSPSLSPAPCDTPL